MRSVLHNKNPCLIIRGTGVFHKIGGGKGKTEREREKDRAREREKQNKCTSNKLNINTNRLPTVGVFS